MTTIPTTQQLKDQNLSILQAAMGQNVPVNNRAFLRILAAMEAMNHAGVYKYAVSRILNALALTADADGLAAIGENYGVIRNQAEQAGMVITAQAANGVTIQATNGFMGDSNGIRYIPLGSAASDSGVITIQIYAETPGAVGNLNVGDTLTIESQVAGASTSAVVSSVLYIGADEEDIESYRARILSFERGATGGGNANDYKIWSESISGVSRALPYAGKPYGSEDPSYPGDRTVYIECSESINSDGIPPQTLLDEVRTAINTDPDTGLSRQPLGLTDSTLYIEPVSRQAFYVVVTGMIVQTDDIASVRGNITAALTDYFNGLSPYLIGIGYQGDRRDRITAVTVAEVVQNVLTGSGGYAVSVTVSLTSGGSPIVAYTLNPGIVSKLGGVSFING